MFRWIEGDAREIAFHVSLLFLVSKENPYVGAGRCVLIQSRAQICLALWLIEIVEHAHFGFIVGPALDFGRARFRKLSVARPAITAVSELWPDTFLFDGKQPCHFARSRRKF